MSTSRASSPWPARFAWATALVSIFLIAFGGSVTTLRAGMAEPGWLQPEGYYLWLYPWEKRIASTGVFVEHHHRELGMVVGNLCILTLLSVKVTKRGKGAFWAAFAALAAVSIQGLLGGTRVLDNSPELAFLHGFVAQLVFGVLVAVAVYLSVAWAQAPAARWTKAPRVRVLAPIALAGVLAQVFFGAWYRHGHGHTAIAIHGLWALVVIYLIMALAKRLKRAAKQEGLDPMLSHQLRRSAFWMTLLLHLQWVLGGITLYVIFLVSDGMHGEHISRGEIIFATLHVTVGALLVGSLVNAVLWSRRLDGPSAQVGSPS